LKKKPGAKGLNEIPMTYDATHVFLKSKKFKFTYYIFSRTSSEKVINRFLWIQNNQYLRQR